MTTSAPLSAAASNQTNGNNNNNNAASAAAATAAASAAAATACSLTLNAATANTASSALTTTTTPALVIPAAASTVTASSTTTTRSMQSDEDFNIRFVNLVRMHKCLYDKKVPEYRNRDNQEKAWTLISKETKESVIHCKERWRNLRACLSRYIKQQNSADPQHKPYYLTEHMAFLLPFLKSTRNSLDNKTGINSLATLFQISQQFQSATAGLQIASQPQLPFHEQKLEMKHSLSDNEDEETIDAFDPAIAASMHLQHAGNVHSPPLSDTASANSMQNFIPDVQIAELETPEPPTAQDIAYVTTQIHHSNGMRQDSRDFAHEPKRIKTECEATTTAPMHVYNENSDMEFFRSILPDIVALTPQQKRKFKIGILELIDDVVERYPAERCNIITTPTNSSKSRRNSSRDWRK